MTTTATETPTDATATAEPKSARAARVTAGAKPAMLTLTSRAKMGAARKAKATAKAAKPAKVEPAKETAKVRADRERAAREAAAADEARRAAFTDLRDRFLLAAEALAKADPATADADDRAAIREAVDRLRPFGRKASAGSGVGGKGIAGYVRDRAKAGASVDEIAAELPAKFPGTGAAAKPRGYASYYSKH